MKKWKRYRNILIVALILDLLAIGVMTYYDIRKSIPDKIWTFVGQDTKVQLGSAVSIESGPKTVEALRVTNKGETVEFRAKREGSYVAEAKLFGFINLKKVTVTNKNKIKVAPYGKQIGIYASTKGLLVLGTGVVEGRDGNSYEPAADIFMPGDYILKWDNKMVTSIKQFAAFVNDNKGKNSTVTVQRKGEIIEVKAKSILAKDNTYKIGLWVREDTQGIGTITYVSHDRKFGALGHGITDVDTGDLLNIKNGEIYKAVIVNIAKGKAGTPGELEGYVNMTKGCLLGQITDNTENGIFGKVNQSIVNELADQFMEVGLKQEIEKGKAYIRTWVAGERKDYEIQIKEVNLAATDNKGMTFLVTDKDLMEKTGGVVQGMSGSPIIQDGRFIGAVTHVFVNDPTKGYGVFAETMLEEE